MYLPLITEDEETDDSYDDFDHLDICADCRGSGKYTGIHQVSHCDTCDGSGWLTKGLGWNKEKYQAYLNQKAVLERRGFGP